MAVLKSPRNSRNKARWAKQYALNSTKSHHIIEERKHPRIAHRLQVFLRDSAHWVSPTGSLPDENAGIPAGRDTSRPPRITKYGRNTFDSTSPHPLIFWKHLSSKSGRKRAFLLINNKNLF